jgi:hypothetical protein
VSNHRKLKKIWKGISQEIRKIGKRTHREIGEATEGRGPRARQLPELLIFLWSPPEFPDLL